jgi:predicted DNA-binding WGR domain protein
MTTTLQITEGASDKFYEVSVDACSVSIRYGRRGQHGTSQAPKLFSSQSEAAAFARKLISDKRKKGYTDGDDGCAVLQTATGASSHAGAKRRAAEPLPEVTQKKKSHVETGAVKKPNDTSSTPSITMLQFTEGSHDKFYEVTVDGNDVCIRYGRRLTAGITQPRKTFVSEADAAAFAAKLVAEKRKGGYVDGDDGMPGASVSDVVEAPCSAAATPAAASCATAQDLAVSSGAAFSSATFVLGSGHMAVGQVVEVGCGWCLVQRYLSIASGTTCLFLQIQGSGAAPYKIKRVDDIVYSCTCPGLYLLQWCLTLVSTHSHTVIHPAQAGQ